MDYPIYGILATIALLFGLALFGWLLITVFSNLFGRDDLSAWGKAGWTLLVLVLPLIGSLVYLVSQSRAMGERELGRTGATHLRMDAYARSVAGEGGYRGVRDVTTTREAMTGPMRQA